MGNQKTIFITSFFGFIARNILRTHFLELLKEEKDLKIIILAPIKKQEQYQREFGGENIIVEGVVSANISKIERLMTMIFHNLSDTTAWRIHRLINLKRDKKYFSTAVFWILAKLGYWHLVRRIFRWLDFKLSIKNRFQEYFEKYNPQLVFSTDIFEPNDISLLREAAFRKIRTVGMVRSWDNITTKGLNRVVPEKLIVNTETVKEEAVLYDDIKPEHISIVGLPHYDNYTTEARVSRAEFFKRLNLNETKKIVFFAPPPDLYAKKNSVSIKVMETLNSMDIQIVVRLPVVGNADLGKFGNPIPYKIAVDRPANSKDFSGADVSKLADDNLKDLLYYSDVVVAFASTLAIDAIVFNKPVVFIGFDGEMHPYWDSLVRYYGYDHQRKLLEMGGVKLAKNLDELNSMIADYLKNPDADKEGRIRIVEERCYRLDGNSGQRLAQVIFGNLK